MNESDDELAAEAAAADLALAVRSLLGMTPRYPATVYGILGNLAETARGLDLLFDRLSCLLGAQLAAGRLGHDRDEPAGPAVAATRRSLLLARTSAQEMHRGSRQAQRSMNALHARCGFPDDGARSRGARDTEVSLIHSGTERGPGNPLSR
ncbi:hypothetical protein [Actinomadura atramentaria]|uniref:hypothetical protein n=1 Tax=Actinomadura atramentaria TaxID=1990 RepID=UPI00039E8F71|nr:hypothetical protein [Actinomadura atramentaria]